ncbi:MAG: T9SS type A sorting domain-containing protein [Paludibacter sp.]|nr:T9SS type A sorting domain-containing protein [Paludibacter sp.]
MKKINLFIFLVAQLFATSMFAQLTTQVANAGDSEINPFIIASADDLLAMNSVYSSAAPSTAELRYFKMTADVDMAGKTWVSFNAASPFNKHVNFDGDGHVIKNLTATGQYAGLFGVLCGVVKNLGVINATLSGSNNQGVIAGYLGSSSPASAAYTGLIENCYTTGTITATAIRVGGIVGYIGGKSGTTISTIRNCYSTVNINSTSTTLGGIAGASVNAFIIENCYSAGKLKTTGGGYVAGILAQQRGTDDATSELKGCVVRGDSLIASSATAVGRISGKILSLTPVSNSLGSEATVVQLTNEPTYLTVFNETEIVDQRYDGVTTSETNLSLQSTYETIGWDFTSNWSTVFHNVYPIHQWLAAREDYKEISGYTSSTDASLSDLKFNGSTINGFSPETYSYQINLPYGSSVPTVEDILATTSHANAGIELTRSTSTFPTTITVSVTAEDEATNVDYIITFNEGPVSGLENTQEQHQIISENGRLIITNAINKNITIYSITGQLIYYTNAINNKVLVPVNKGIYVVKVENQINKVTVK